MDVQKVVAGILEKVAAKKEEEKKVEKKEDKKEIVKGMSSCKYAHSIADALDEISDNFEYNFGSELDKAQKLAYESPNTLARSTATGANFKDKNEHRDAMAVGEDPAMGDRGNENGITPNHLKTTLAHPPGGKEKIDPAHPPLYNKTADTYQKILKKLAGDKTAYESPNALRTMTVTDSGAGQQGYDSGKSDGNNLRHLIHTSNEKAMDYTKADAKKDYIKEQMSQVFDEVHPEKDTAIDRFIDRGADTSKLAGLKDVAGKVKDVASRGVELAKGGKKQFMMGADKQVMNARPGNTAQGFKGKTTRTEAAKSTAVRAGLAGAAGAAGYGAHKAMSKKADEETVSKMERLVKEEKKDEKVEEKIHPGIHKEVAKAEHKKEAGIQDIAGHALGGLAGAATKAHELGKGAVNYVKQNPGRVAAGLGTSAALGGLTYGVDRAGDAAGQYMKEKLENQVGPIDRWGLGANLGGLAGAAPGLMMMTHGGMPLLGAVPTVLGAGLGAAGGQALENRIRGQGQPTKEAQVISKLASILLSYKTASSEGALGDGSAVAPGGMDVGQAVPQEAGAPTAGTPEQIEKLKKILLMMQLKKQQEEAAMAQAQQGNMQVPPEMTAQTSPGAVQGI
jgi:hypothetical protein